MITKNRSAFYKESGSDSRSGSSPRFIRYLPEVPNRGQEYENIILLSPSTLPRALEMCKRSTARTSHLPAGQGTPVPQLPYSLSPLHQIIIYFEDEVRWPLNYLAI